MTSQPIIQKLAAEVLDRFRERWEAAEDDPEAPEYLLKLLLVRVWAKDGQIVGLCLRPGFHITAGLDAKRPTELVVDLEGDCYRSGSDGLRSLVATMLLCSLLSGPGGRESISARIAYT